jgi:multidrug transporter EmrE-like cation transporter
MIKIISQIHYLIWLFLSVVVFGYGEYLSKRLALDVNLKSILFILFVYCIGILFWLPAILIKNQLSITGVIWAVMSSIATLMVGLLIFKEQLSVTGIVGVILAIISIVLLTKA